MGQFVIPLVGEILSHTISDQDNQGMWIVNGSSPFRFLVRDSRGAPNRKIRLIGPNCLTPAQGEETLCIGAGLDHLDDQDILTFSLVHKRLYVQWKNKSHSNSVLLTERCDNYCIMCSQPPKSAPDSHLLDNANSLVSALKLVQAEHPVIGLTGGEPTLYGTKLVNLIERILKELPSYDIHLLSNGRRFAKEGFCDDFAEVLTDRLVIGIPIYGSIAEEHDYTVGAQGAFFETVQGLQNLLERSAQIELRVVLQKSTCFNLTAITDFIVRNLHGVSQVSLMGLELMGFARSNFGAVWVDPIDYLNELRRSVLLLEAHGFNPRIFNHQLCVIDPEIRRFAVRSISDWKQDYDAACDSCVVKADCGGFFSSSDLAISRAIRPLQTPSEKLINDDLEGNSETKSESSLKGRRRLKVSVDLHN